MTQQSTLFDAGAPERAESVIGHGCGNRDTVAPAKRLTALPGALPGKPGAKWRAWTKDTPEEEAAAAFRRRYGRWPEYIVDGRGGLLLVGPVPESEV